MKVFINALGKTRPSDSGQAAASAGRSKSSLPAERWFQSSCVAGLSTRKIIVEGQKQGETREEEHYH